MELLALFIIGFAVLVCFKIFAVLFDVAIFAIALPFKILACFLGIVFGAIFLIPLGLFFGIIGVLLAPLLLLVEALPYLLIIFGVIFLLKKSSASA